MISPKRVYIELSGSDADESPADRLQETLPEPTLPGVAPPLAVHTPMDLMPAKLHNEAGEFSLALVNEIGHSAETIPVPAETTPVSSPVETTPVPSQQLPAIVRRLPSAVEPSGSSVMGLAEQQVAPYSASGELPGQRDGAVLTAAQDLLGHSALGMAVGLLVCLLLLLLLLTLFLQRLATKHGMTFRVEVINLPENREITGERAGSQRAEVAHGGPPPGHAVSWPAWPAAAGTPAPTGGREESVEADIFRSIYDNNTALQKQFRQQSMALT